MPVKDNKNFQSTSKWPRSPKNPNKEFIAIIKREVPTAFFIGNPANNTKIGTMIKPPPAPIKPVTKPVIRPKISTLCNWCCYAQQT